MSFRAISIHGHFYQPPREDPVTGTVPIEAGAFPYNNWNERIHAECYLPNAQLGNFERISFNVGPTLLSWMKGFDPGTMRLIIEQDSANVKRYGVGNAMAQPYHHTILPLATTADKITQVEWGIADFEYHFGHKPWGMWLPEAAVDLETLDILAERGIEFTILAPWQAEPDHIDVTEPYRVALPSGKSITIFFYHQGLSTGLSFTPQLTVNADEFIRKAVLPSYLEEKEQRGEPQLLLIASDGELYGHHQQFRDRFLTHLINGAISEVGLEKTFPALWLKEYPAQRWVRIREGTSWSCAHGIERWRGSCGCTSGDASWKGHLRQAYNRLAIQIDRIYSETTDRYRIDPWKLRNEYIQVILGQLPIEDVINQIARRKIEEEGQKQIRLLLKAQWERQRMFTSCSWYFGDFSRIEPGNSIAYAAQAVYLTHLATGVDLSDQVIDDLKFATSKETGLRGDTVFQNALQKSQIINSSH